MRHSASPGRADSARLTVAVLLAVLLHLALAQVPIAWRAPVAPLAAPIQISLLSPPAAPPAAAVRPVAPRPTAPAPVVETAPLKPESKPEPPKPSRSVVTAKAAKLKNPVHRIAKSQPPKPKPAKPKPPKPKPLKPKPTPSILTRPAKAAPESPARLAAAHPSSTPSSPMASDGESEKRPVGGATTSKKGRRGAPASTAVNPRPLPGNPSPRYPSLARRRGEEGQVLLQLTVNAAGRVEAVSVARSSGYELLDQAAQRTVARWRFQPPRAERMVARIPITFRLRD
ncbi:MAG: energy transducer TonB [Candidatus Competibacteraceae bacterium]|nr:energy transducer TonB [Candidatus Competibacteraceae bacterium]